MAVPASVAVVAATSRPSGLFALSPLLSQETGRGQGADQTKLVEMNWPNLSKLIKTNELMAQNC